MKPIIKTWGIACFFPLLTLLSWTTQAQGATIVHAPAHTKVIQLEPFTQLNVDVIGPINIVYGDRLQLEIKRRDACSTCPLLLPKITTEVNNGTLFISQEGRQDSSSTQNESALSILWHALKDKSSGKTLLGRINDAFNPVRHDNLTFTLATHTLHSINQRGEGNIDVKDARLNRIHTLQYNGAGNINIAAVSTDLSVIAAGIGNITVDRMEGAQNIFVKSPSVGNVTLSKIHGANSVKVQVSGTGDVILTGDAHTLSATLSGVGEIDAKNLAVEQANYTLSGVGAINVNAKHASGNRTGVGNFINHHD